MMDFETAARKIAATHPVLVLRESAFFYFHVASFRNLREIFFFFLPSSHTKDLTFHIYNHLKNPCFLHSPLTKDFIFIIIYLCLKAGVPNLENTKKSLFRSK